VKIPIFKKNYSRINIPNDSSFSFTKKFFLKKIVKLKKFPAFIIIIIIIIINSCPSHQGTMALTSCKCCNR